jgi:hypothetical protein
MVAVIVISSVLHGKVRPRRSRALGPISGTGALKSVCRLHSYSGSHHVPSLRMDLGSPCLFLKKIVQSSTAKLDMVVLRQED